MGCCLFACIGAIWPRVTLVIMWIIGYAPLESRLWPFMGFLFLPATTLAYKLCLHWMKIPSIDSSAVAMIIVAVAFLHDLGQLGMIKGMKDDPGT